MIAMSAPARPPTRFCTDTTVYDTPADPLMRLFSSVVPSFCRVVSDESNNSVTYIKLMTSVLPYRFRIAVMTTLAPGNGRIRMGKYQHHYHHIELAKALVTKRRQLVKLITVDGRKDLRQSSRSRLVHDHNGSSIL